ncbi:flagellar hook-length control protein FliK [Marinomonas balearica]|uniref:Flagellar hook-length control protein FliK n=1 Tax=Marinomonas balearica TaxID=491947 RepID=A0A4R6MDN5_9GAMM|nr:flagellar hook-length control protein FliK [Marinomonas balearica]TDO98319.1 flagellar hook-length control protein FliK [Marinomonas balearica]
MLSNINSLLNNSTTKTADNKVSDNKTSGNSSTGALTGKIATLTSELKLINSLQPIRVTSVQTAQTQQGPTQFIRVTNNQSKPFTVINDQPNNNIKVGDTGNLDASNSKSSLTLNVKISQSNADSAQTSRIQNNPQNNSTQNATQVPQNTSTTNTARQADTGSPKLTYSASPSASATSNANPTANSKEVLTSIKIVSEVFTLKALSNSTNTTPNANTTTNTNSTSPLNTSPQKVQNTATFQTTVTDGSQELTLTTKAPLKAGDSLSVFVDKQGNIQLAPTQPRANANTPTTEALKQSLPNQATFQEFTNTLKSLQNISSESDTLTPKVQSALNQLVKEFPNLSSLISSPNALKSAILSSGLFAESNLAKNTESLPQDLKLNLIRLQNAQQDSDTATTKSPNQQISNSMNSIAGAIDRISTNQLRHFVEQSQSDNTVYPLHIELPIKNGSDQSMVKLTIDQDRDTKEEVDPHKRRWLIQLKFDFEETGKFEARVSVQERNVSALFAVENQITEKLIKTHFPSLKKSLQEKDIVLDRLDAFITKFKEEKEQPLSTTKRLIDVRT